MKRTALILAAIFCLSAAAFAAPEKIMNPKMVKQKHPPRYGRKNMVKEQNKPMVIGVKKKRYGHKNMIQEQKKSDTDTTTTTTM